MWTVVHELGHQVVQGHPDDEDHGIMTVSLPNADQIGDPEKAYEFRAVFGAKSIAQVQQAIAVARDMKLSRAKRKESRAYRFLRKKEKKE